MPQDGLDTQMTMPEFTIKAKDMFAIQTLRFHRQLCIEANLRDQADEEQRAIDEMLLWRDHNRRLIKYPDHNHVPAARPQHVPSGFRGLAHVVDVWRSLKRETRNGIADDCPALHAILNAADRYMCEIEREPAVNESALPPGMGEKQCNSTHAHVAHRWSSGPIDAFWCVGRRMSTLQ